SKITQLKADLSLLVQLTQERKQGEALVQKLSHLKENLKHSQLSMSEVSETLKKHHKLHQDLADELLLKLQGKSAQEELSLLSLKIKEASSELQKSQMVQRNFEQALSLKRGNLSSIDQLLKDYEMEFIKVREEITKLSHGSLEPLNEEVASFEEKLKHITLSLDDSIEIIFASKDFVGNVLT